MTQRIICIYHANCADGFTAAWVVREALGPKVEFIPASYGSEPPEAKDADVILVDFSYKRDVLEELAERANSVLVLDHHKTAVEDLVFYPTPLGGFDDISAWEVHVGDATRDARVRSIWAVLDTGRSGAQIAWDFFHGRDDDSHLPRPKLVDYVADRDLWLFKLPHSRAIAAALFSRPFDFPTWNEIASDMEDASGMDVLATEGYAIERKHHKDLTDLLKATRREMTFGDHRVPVANVPYFMASDAGHVMAEGQPFAATYTDGADGLRRFSLRSHTAGEDVSKIAASYGGGGHARAAGFQMPIGWEGDDAATSATDRLQKVAATLTEWADKRAAGGEVTPSITTLRLLAIAVRANITPTVGAALAEADIDAQALDWITPAAATTPTDPPEAWKDVLLERVRQISIEGWTHEHDDEHWRGEMAAAAACYALGTSSVIGSAPPKWPWDDASWKPKDPRSNLVRAGALILAEIERFDRAEGKA